MAGGWSACQPEPFTLTWLGGGRGLGGRDRLREGTRRLSSLQGRIHGASRTPGLPARSRERGREQLRRNGLIVRLATFPSPAGVTLIQNFTQLRQALAFAVAMASGLLHPMRAACRAGGADAPA